MRLRAREATWSLRRPESDDVPALLDFVSHGIESYRSIAPTDWVPPLESSPTKVERTLAELENSRNYSQMAEVDGRIAGFVHWCEPDPPVALRLRFLFVAEPFWGSGLAHQLHDGSVTAMGDRSARLFTPAGQIRARRFYERGCWHLHAEMESSDLGIPLVEYRRAWSRDTDRHQDQT